MVVNYTVLRQLTYTQLGKMLSTGAITESALRQFYRVERRKAQSRLSKLRSKAVVAEYGKQDLPRFRKEKNLITVSDLVHEIADLNRFLNKKESLVSGLKKAKEARKQQLEEMGVDTSNIDWGLWNSFSKWFNLSEYSKRFEYIEIVDIWENELKNVENPSTKDWEDALKRYSEHESKKSKRKHY